MDSPTSDTPRQSLLGSINFLARSNRPRAATTSNNTTETPATAASTPGHRRRPAASNAAAPPAQQVQGSASGGLGYMLRRRRSATALAERAEHRAEPPSGPTHRIRLVPHLESHRSLHFEAITRDVRQGDPPLRIGRFTDRSTHAGSNSNKLAFKSKVVSRGHAEVWFDAGSFYIKDTKSSSGTFLNHIRLSSPNSESRPHPIKDGDVLQLGVDYQGGTEEIYRCVKMRVELGREWQSGVNAFNSNALLQLKTLSGAVAPPSAKAGPAEKRTRTNITDCCICLFQVTVCQSLFIAPCSHVYHYKCIRPLLEMHHPGFSCPLCRTFADLEADVEVEHRDVDSGATEDVEMAAGDAEAAHAMGDAASPEPNDVPEVRQADVDVDVDVDVDDADADADADDADEGDGDVEGDGDGDGDRTTSSSLSNEGAAIDADVGPVGGAGDAIPIPIAIPMVRQDSGETSGAEATPLNSTFLATLVGSGGEGHGAGGGGGGVPVRGTMGLDAIAMSDEGESVEEGGGGGVGREVGGKRKR